MTDARIVTITMPKWGMTMTEGKVGAWLKREGDAIEPGEEFVEIETDKIANAVEAELAGTLRRILVVEGESAPCGAPIALLADPEVDEAALDAAAEAAARAKPEAAEAQTMARRRVEAGGIGISVVTAGDAEGGLPVAMLHGFGSDAAAWMFVQGPLAEGRRVHALDLPSHGESDVAADCASLDALADAAAAALDALEPGRLHLVGHSLGGRIALRLAALWGERVASLTLIAPAGLGAPISHDFVDAFLGADKRRPMKEALRMLVADPDAVTSEMVERTLAMKRGDGVPEALRAIADANFQEDRVAEGAGADLKAATAPVLVIRGEADRVAPPGDLPEGLRVVDLPGVGHMPQMEAAGRVVELLAAQFEGRP